jgi:hypothetical protein
MSYDILKDNVIDLRQIIVLLFLHEEHLLPFPLTGWRCGLSTVHEVNDALAENRGYISTQS